LRVIIVSTKFKYLETHLPCWCRTD